MRAAYRLSYLNEFKVWEIVSIFLIILFLLQGVYLDQLLLLLLSVPLFIYLFIKCINKKNAFLWYRFSISIATAFIILFVSSLLFNFLYIKEYAPFFYVISLLLISVNFIVLTFNLLFLMLVKLIFPYHRVENSIEFRKRNYKMISKHISISDQKGYIYASVLNSVIYIIFVILVYFFLVTILPVSNNTIYLSFERWVEKQEWVNLSNILGYLSVMIAIFTLTISYQKKLIAKAESEYEQWKSEYDNRSEKILALPKRRSPNAK